MLRHHKNDTFCITGEIMKDSKNDSKLGPQIAEPNNDEINEMIADLKNKYDFFIPRDDAIKYWKLKEEFDWWRKAEKEARDPKVITKETTKEVQNLSKKYHSNDITLDEASYHAKDFMARAATIEKERIAKEINAIVTKYR